jgi:cytochrome c peroxidase
MCASRLIARAVLGALVGLIALFLLAPQSFTTGSKTDRALDRLLTARLHELGFTGRIESTLAERLGRPLDRRLADLGRLLWFDTITGLQGDNTCAGCHSPTHGFGDTQSIAIGIDNNGVVGPSRTGPRNMRRTPTVINTAFYPRLMWNSRFAALSNDPFDNSLGYRFPDPEGASLSYLPHLLAAQAFIPPTERNEVAGFDFEGDNDAIREEMCRRLNEAPEYRRLFGAIFPDVRDGGPITPDMFALAIAEFEFSLTFANAPIDRYARGELDALTDPEKRGALLFFGDAGCVDCHAVSGASNEMFSDFEEHNIGVPQLVPAVTNSTFAGPAANEDFGLADVTGDAADRYRFRTSPLRNVAVQAAFMHDGAYTSLAASISHHLDAVTAARAYDPADHGLDPDLAGPTAPVEPILANLDPLSRAQVALTNRQFRDLLAFVRDSLLDPRARPERLERLVPAQLPSGRPALRFEFPAVLGAPSARP